MNTPLKIALCGLGTVGSAVFRLINSKSELFKRRFGAEINIVAVSARDKGKERDISLDDVAWFDDAIEMARVSDANVVVELIGGSEGVALEVCQTALATGKDIVTANKALLAVHGFDLARRADEGSRSIGYEAAVAGGIPVIKALREGLVCNEVVSLYGILNGTSNFILTEMRNKGLDFETVLKDAQRLGYAEADPEFDVNGVDAGHKLSLLTALAFETKPDFNSVSVEGIANISELDIRFADELGYRIKLLGIARKGPDGIQQSVRPCMVPKGLPMANVDGVFNAIAFQGDDTGPVFLEGRGAGAGPTASAVIADLADLARGLRLPTFGVPIKDLKPSNPASEDSAFGRFYVRLMVLDRPGVFADVAAALREQDVSMEAILQRTRAPGAPVPVVMTTHEVNQSAINKAIDQFSSLETVVEEPRIIKIENLSL